MGRVAVPAMLLTPRVILGGRRRSETLFRFGLAACLQSQVNVVTTRQFTSQMESQKSRLSIKLANQRRKCDVGGQNN